MLGCDVSYTKPKANEVAELVSLTDRSCTFCFTGSVVQLTLDLRDDAREPDFCVATAVRNWLSILKVHAPFSLYDEQTRDQQSPVKISVADSPAELLFLPCGAFRLRQDVTAAKVMSCMSWLADTVKTHMIAVFADGLDDSLSEERFCAELFIPGHDLRVCST
jgi:hypothetical protein